MADSLQRNPHRVCLTKDVAPNTVVVGVPAHHVRDIQP